MIGLDALLRRERWLVGLALAALAALAWWQLWRGAGMGMPAWQMTAAVFFPHRSPDLPGRMAADWPLVLAMWWVMMVAMMTPAAIPLVLLYRRVVAHHGLGRWSQRAATAALLLGYLAAWLGFSLAAAVVQWALEPTALLSGSMWWSRSAALSAALLFAAGAYQWSPWKHRCLTQCRAPSRFLAQYARPGLAAAWRLGLQHGGYCVGCCGLLMALLFVGGVMNLVWIAALSILVSCEKLLPGGEAIARASGAVLLAWAVATLVV